MQNTKPKKTLTKKSEILREALKHLSPHLPDEEGRHKYICYAVGKVVNPGDCYSTDHPLQKEIASRLHPWTSFETWLISKGITPSAILKDRNKGSKKVQRTRK